MSKLDNLTSAIRAAIRHKCDRSQISVPAWAQTYGVPMKTIREAWERELTKETNSTTGEDE